MELGANFSDNSDNIVDEVEKKIKKFLDLPKNLLTILLVYAIIYLQ